MPPGFAIDFGDNDGFRLKVKPRATDGYDTLTVVVVADGIPAALCQYRIFVQAEKRPELTMVCSADPDVLTFDPNLNDYVPNPFTVRTIVTNTGKSLAHDCEFLFVGPRKFEPYGQDSHQKVSTPGGILNVGQSDTLVWQMRALPQDVATTEYMIFQVHGKGGLEDDIVIGECRVKITVPPVLAAAYEVTCSSPKSLTYDVSSGTYIPDPFVDSVRIKNIGLADGQDIKVTMNFPGRVFLASGETQEKTIASLPIGASTVLTWQLRAIAQPYVDTVDLCANLVDKFLTTAECCSKTIVPPATQTTLTPMCWAEYDTLTVNTALGDYDHNPFKVYLTLTNNGKNPIDSIYATLTRGTNDLRILDQDVTKFIAQQMSPGQALTVPIEWLVRAIPRTITGWVTMRFRITSKNLAPIVCELQIYIPEIGRPRLDCNIISTTPGVEEDHFLNFDQNIGDYEGEPDPSGSGYNTFTLKVNVNNVGEAVANHVSARITVLNGGVTLIDGESPTKLLIPEDITVQGNAYQTWTFRPLRQADTALRTFEVTLTSSNADLKVCTYDLTIQGAPKVVDVALPNDAIGQFGDKIAIPIHVGPTIGKDVNIYKLNVQFDPTVVHFVDAINENTQTQFGWNGPRTQLFTVGGSAEPNVVRVQDFTTGSPLASKTDGNLVYLIFEAVYGGNDATKLDHAASDLKFLSEVTDGGNTYKSSMNSSIDAENGNITLNTIDGLVTVSGECIVPLNSSLKFQLAQNKPNPFNPTTVIEYTVGVDSHVKLEVFDALGRHVRTLVDEFQKAGNYRQVFDATDLPSGTYIYKLESPQFNEAKRMVLTR
jgi:hypothetical protein